MSPGMVASVPSQGNEQMAATLLQITQSQVEASMGEHSLYSEGVNHPLHSMMEGKHHRNLKHILKLYIPGENLLECHLREEDSEEVSVKKKPKLKATLDVSVGH